MSIKEIARMFNDKISGCEEDFFCGTKTSFMQFWKSFVLFLIFTPSIDCWNVTFFLIHQNRNWVKKRQHSRATKTFNGINYKKKNHIQSRNFWKDWWANKFKEKNKSIKISRWIMTNFAR